MRGLAVDFAPIRVNALRAGFFDTPFLDEALGDQRAVVVADLEARLLVGRIGRPEEAEAACRYVVDLRPGHADGHNNLAVAL